MIRIGTLLFVASMVSAKIIGPVTNSTHTKLELRIVGGYSVSIENFPYQVSLRYGGRHDCGGSIYNSNVIITAAHCVYNDTVSYLKVAAGSSLKEITAQVVPVKQYIIHNEYSKTTLNNDIAIVILDGHLEFNKNVRPIALATSRPIPGSKVIASGWGDTGSGFHSEILQEVQVEVIDQTSCEKAYSGLYTITKNMICAGDKNGGKDSCSADSGGPLSYNQKLLGVVSFGEGCGLRRYPGVYSSIPDLYDWIVKTVSENGQ